MLSDNGRKEWVIQNHFTGILPHLKYKCVYSVFAYKRRIVYLTSQAATQLYQLGFFTRLIPSSRTDGCELLDANARWLRGSFQEEAGYKETSNGSSVEKKAPFFF